MPLLYSTAESSPFCKNQRKGCQGCGVSGKRPARQRAARCPASPYRSSSAEPHPCKEGKRRQGLRGSIGEDGKDKQPHQEGLQASAHSPLCNSNLMSPKCQNPSNLPPGGSTQPQSPNQNTWCTSGSESTCWYLGIRGFGAEKTVKILYLSGTKVPSPLTSMLRKGEQHWKL